MQMPPNEFREQVQWLWYPYIPLSKVTLLQGNPGAGKSMLITYLISVFSKGGMLPDGTQVMEAKKIIYQNLDDDAGLTKSRLESFGANCENIAYVNGIHLNNDRFRRAIEEYRPHLVVIDPLDAFVTTKLSNREKHGELHDIHKTMRTVVAWASLYDCSILIIDYHRKRKFIEGHEIVKSILQVSQEGSIRTIRQIKNAYGSSGPEFSFEIGPDTGFRWLETRESPLPEENTEESPKTQYELAVHIMKTILSVGQPIESATMKKVFMEHGVGEKCLTEVRNAMGIKPQLKNRKWYLMHSDREYAKPKLSVEI